MDLDVTKNINIIESLKSNALYKMADLFRYQDAEGQVMDKSGTVADLMILLYLLAEKMGYSYSVTDKNIINRLTAGIKSEEGEWREDLKLLLRHMEK